MTVSLNLKALTSPDRVTSMNADSASRGSPSTNEQMPFESCSGNIGSTFPGRYTLVARSTASLSRLVPSAT